MPSPTKKQISLFSYAAWMVIPLGLVLLGGLWLIGNINLTKTVESEVERNVAQMGAQITTRVRERLDGLANFARSVARNSLIINGLIDFEGRDAYLPTFFRSLEAPASSHAKFWMVDYKGRVVVASDPGAPVPDLSERALRVPIFEARGDAINISEPIFYQGVAEGAIIVRFSAQAFAEIFDVIDFESFLGVSRQQGGWIYVTNEELGSRLAVNSPSVNEEWVVSSHALSSHDLRVVVASSLKKEYAVLETVQFLQVLGLFAYLSFAVLLVTVTAYVMTKPLNRLTRRLSEIRAVGHLDERVDTTGPREIGQLAESFNQMFERLSDSMRETERLNRDLREAQKLEAVGQLAGGIAHEINTPSQYIGDNLKFMRNVQGKLLEIVDQALPLADAGLAENEHRIRSEAVRQIVEAAHLDFIREELPAATNEAITGVEQISSIVQAMKEFSHPGSKEKSPTDVNRALNSTVTIARNSWKQLAKMETDLDPALPLVPCLPGELNQVYLNLIVNAAHAIEAAHGDSGQGKITVRTREEPGAVSISIEDNGVGMDRAVRDRIFEPFFTTKGVGRGTGQGLAIAHDIIVNKHGGQILVDSRPGEGSTFTIRLPIDEDGEGQVGERQE